MSLVGRDISTGFFKTLKAATLIIIEDEIEEKLSAYDIWHAQFCEEWRLLHEFSDDAEGEDGGNDIFDEDHIKKYKSHRRLSPSINLFTIEEEYWEKKKIQMTLKRFK